MSTPRYSVIIPAWNEQDALPGTLEALRRAMNSVAAEGEVIVVDNGSSDCTAKVAEQWGAWVVCEPWRSISRARNRGAQLAQGDYLIFVDADTHVCPGTLNVALRTMGRERCCGGGFVVHFDGPLPPAARMGVSAWNTIASRAGMAAGCCAFATREAFDAVGGFPEWLYAAEDMWMSLKMRRYARQNGTRFVVHADAGPVTSARKFRSHSFVRLLLPILGFVVFPPALAVRELCGMWYGSRVETEQRRGI